MAKTNNTKKRADGPATALAGADPAPESLDKVRDILFGGQMRMVESRLQSIEARFQEQLKTLRNDYTRQLSDLDGSVRKELAALTDRLAAERAKRAEDLKALGIELRDAYKALEKRHGKLEEATSLADADLRDQVLTQTAALSAEFNRVAERITGELDRRASALASEKVDTTALVGLLNDLAARLGGNGRGSAKGGGRS